VLFGVHILPGKGVQVSFAQEKNQGKKCAVTVVGKVSQKTHQEARLPCSSVFWGKSMCVLKVQLPYCKMLRYFQVGLFKGKFFIKFCSLAIGKTRQFIHGQAVHCWPEQMHMSSKAGKSFI